MNGTSNVVGSVPPASWAANVVTSHSNSLGSMVMFGMACSNSSTRAKNASRVADLAGMDDITKDSGPCGLEPLIDVEELAEYLGAPMTTIYDWRANGKGPLG